MTLLAILAVIVLMIGGIFATWAGWMRARRQASLPLAAAGAGLQFSDVDRFNSAAVPFRLFREGDGRRIQNMMWRETDGHPRVFDFGFFRRHRDSNGNTYDNWRWFTCALAQHNGKWPELRVTKERVVDRAGQALGLPDIELESEAFNRTYVVQCEDPKFATDLLDPQMMEFVLGTKGMVNFETKGRFLLLTTSHLEADAMVGLLGVAEGFVARVPPMVWDVYGRFPPGMGTQDMPTPPTDLSVRGEGRWMGRTMLGDPPPPREPFQFADRPNLRSLGEAWDPSPGIEHDLDGNPMPDVEEDPWGRGTEPAS